MRLQLLIVIAEEGALGSTLLWRQTPFTNHNQLSKSNIHGAEDTWPGWTLTCACAKWTKQLQCHKITQNWNGCIKREHLSRKTTYPWFRFGATRSGCYRRNPSWLHFPLQVSLHYSALDYPDLLLRSQFFVNINNSYFTIHSKPFHFKLVCDETPVRTEFASLTNAT